MVLSLLHMSDFHTGKDDYGQIRLFESIVGQVQVRCDQEGPPDLVLITGDIANRGLDTEYQLFLDSFVGPLRAALSSAGPVPILLVPGNHDVDRGKCPTTVSYGHADSHPEYFDPTAKGLALREPSLPRFAAYHRFLEGAGLGAQRLDQEKSYYALDVSVRGTKVGVVGLNSAWLSQDPVERGTLYGGRKGAWEERECLTPGLSALAAGLQDTATSDVALVLSHHPISWYRLEDQDRFRALLGQNRALFAHGHLHRTQSRVSEGVGLLFRALQAGAAFQARNDSIWRNRFCWYTVEPESLEVLATPLSWDTTQHSWVIDGDAFPPQFIDGGRWRLPGLDRVAGAVCWVPPRGCVVVSGEYLAASKELLSEDDLVAFFDGAIPTWRHVLSDRIPSRPAVTQLVRAYSKTIGNPGPPLIRLVTGAGGEGKSTVLLQTAAALIRAVPSWRALYLAAPDASLSEKDVLALPSGSTPWLVLADDAERVADVCAKAASALWDSGRRDVHFLLAARDTDWKALGADKRSWHEFSDFEEKLLRGLTHEDSEAIIGAWERLGVRGLGRLVDVPEAERSTALRRAATLHGARTEGSFFGAALQVRLGAGLRDHVRSLLCRLEERVATGSYSLMDALVLIAAPHSINLLTLTPDILAEALSATPIATRLHVLIPLGEEAAAVQDGRFLLIRHRAVAQAVMDVAAQQCGVDDGACFETLVRAVNRLRPTRRMPGFNDFNYLSKRFREVLHRPDVAVRLARALVEEEPRNRHYLQELGVCFGEAKRYAANVCACLASVADYPECEPPTADNSSKALGAIGFALGLLWKETNDPVFVRGKDAVVNLGLRLPADSDPAGHFRRYERSIEPGVGVPLESSMDALRSAAVATWEAAAPEMPGGVGSPSVLSLNGLARRCGVA